MAEEAYVPGMLIASKLIFAVQKGRFWPRKANDAISAPFIWLLYRRPRFTASRHLLDKWCLLGAEFAVVAYAAVGILRRRGSPKPTSHR